MSPRVIVSFNSLSAIPLADGSRRMAITWRGVDGQNQRPGSSWRWAVPCSAPKPQPGRWCLWGGWRYIVVCSAADPSSWYTLAHSLLYDAAGPRLRQDPAAGPPTAGPSSPSSLLAGNTCVTGDGSLFVYISPGGHRKWLERIFCEVLFAKKIFFFFCRRGYLQLFLFSYSFF